MADVAVTADRHDEDLESRARDLAGKLKLPYVPVGACCEGEAALHLCVTPWRLELQRAADPRIRVYVDFARGRAGHRRRHGGGRSQLIAKAVGLGEGELAVIDATAGLGQDAFVLASLGCSVMCIERSPVMWALLDDGLHRALYKDRGEAGSIASSIQLRHGDAGSALRLPDLEFATDVVYLDPMYPVESKGSALARKESELTRQAVGDDADAAELLEVGREVATSRVVVKRPRRAPPLGPGVAFTYESTKTRYDVYLPTGG